MQDLTKEFLSKFLSYDPETGIFTRIGYSPANDKRCSSKLLGRPTGVIGKHGYVHIAVGKGVRVHAHRLAFVLMTGNLPAYVDHVDGNRQNNKWSNLRLCNMSQNMSNRGASTRSTSGVKGVFPHKPSGRWRVQIMVMYKTVSLGYFDTLEEAERAYNVASEKYFGEFKHNPHTWNPVR